VKVYLNGDMAAADGALVRADDRGLTLGDGLFETLRVRGGDVLRRDAHLARLRAGMGVLSLDGAPGDADLARALDETAAANEIQDGVLRLTLTRGPGRRGVLPPDDPRPTVLITAAALPGADPAPQRAVIARVTRRNEHSPLSQCKCLNYLDNILARQEAETGGADEALLLNTAGRLAEASAANLFLVLDGALVTPPLADGALPGVMRADVIAQAGGRERSLAPDDLGRASEAFLTNSLGIRPLVSVDGAPIGAGEPGPVWERLKKIP